MEIEQNFVCFLSGLLMALGSEHGSKSLPKRTRGGEGVLLFLGGLEGSWELLGALGLQDSPRADFWTQLNQI